MYIQALRGRLAGRCCVYNLTCVSFQFSLGKIGLYWRKFLMELLIRVFWLNRYEGVLSFSYLLWNIIWRYPVEGDWWNYVIILCRIITLGNNNSGMILKLVWQKKKKLLEIDDNNKIRKIIGTFFSEMKKKSF